MSCGVGPRRGPDLALLWLWYRPVATAPIRLLAWEHPYSVGAALKRKKKKKKKRIAAYSLETGRKMLIKGQMEVLSLRSEIWERVSVEGLGRD